MLAVSHAHEDCTEKKRDTESGLIYIIITFLRCNAAFRLRL